jgi:L-alanine-DL-glutamate epimerase-like enolase superfamily enzyme
MSAFSRRALLALGGLAACGRRPMAGHTGLRIEEIRHDFEDFSYRTPMKWGKATIDRTTILNVHCIATTRNGRSVRGFGSMKMGNTWAFRSDELGYDGTLAIMKTLAGRIGGLTADYREYAHPIDVNHELEPAYLRAAAELGAGLKLRETVPELFTLVTASAFDAALHDAFGKAYGRSCYATYGPDFMPHGLSRYLGPEFAGEFMEKYVSAKPKDYMPVYHLVGGADAITGADVASPVRDGLPESLEDWIRAEGLTHFKIKMRGDDLAWDVDRVLRVHRAVEQTQRELGIGLRRYSLDFNEMCPNVQYLLDFFHRVRERAPAAFTGIQYVEQPTRRDLAADRGNAMHEAAKLVPVVIDESLTDLESLKLAREMGYSGVALKAGKGQTQSLLMAAAAQKFGMFLCVQDLTCPGASLIHSAGLAAHVPPVVAIEANARQFVPIANEAWASKFPGLFRIQGGMMRTGEITSPGLGAVIA